MVEKFNESKHLDKESLKSEKSKEFLRRYQEQREQYYKTKNKNDKITEEQRKTIDAEMDAKINQLYQQETQKKSEAIAEISSIQEGLNALDTSSVKNLNIPDFKFLDSVGFGSVQAIREQAQLYATFNEGINKKVADLSNLYNKFTQVVNRFNKEKDDDTRRSGSSDYKKYVDTINQKIQEYKKLFQEAEQELTKAINQSDRAGQQLNSAPDDLRKTEGENKGSTEGQFKDQQGQHIAKLNAYNQQGEKLDQSSQNLGHAQQFLDVYSDQLVQVTDNLTVQRAQVNDTLSDWDTKRKDFQNIINTVCMASGVAPFTDEELKNLLTNPENFIGNLQPQERAQAAVNLYNGYGGKLAEYIQIIERYGAGIQQRDQLTQGLQAIENRQAQVAQSQDEVLNQQQIVSDEIIANNSRIEEVKGEMVESQAQYEQSVEYYHQNMDDIDTLDYEMSSVILDTDIGNHGALESIASQVKSFDGMEVSAKGFREKGWDSTVGMIGKGIRNYVLEPAKELLLALPNLIQSIGENNPSIGNSRLFKIINEPLQVTAGITEGVFELTEGLVQMVEQPVATLNGLGQLIGRDPITGEWSFGTAGDAWTNFGKAMIAYDDWGEGNDGRALGKGIANIGTLLIPFAGEASAAANTAKVARAVGGVSRTRAALIGVTDFGYRVGGKMVRGTKNLAKGTYKFITGESPKASLNSLRGIAEDVAKSGGPKKYIGKKALNYAKDKLEGVAEDIKGKGGIKNYAKESVSETYHNVGGVKGIAKGFTEVTTGYVYAKGAWRLIKGEPLFGKKFPSLKKLPDKRLKMEQRLQKLKGANGVGGELDAMYGKVSKYLDKDGNLLEGVKGAEIPMKDWGKIADYQSALQEAKYLKATIAQYKQVETSLIDESGKPTKLGKLVEENKNFGKMMEDMLANPSKAKEIFAQFKKKNPKVDFSELENLEIFRDGNKVYRIKNGELVEGEGTVKRKYTAEDYKMTPEGFDEVVAEGYEPGTAEFNEYITRNGMGEPIELKVGTSRMVEGMESLKMENTGEINPNNFEVGDIIEFNDTHVPEIKIKTKFVENGKVYYDLEVSEGTTYRHVPAEEFKIPVNASEGVYPHNLKFAKGVRRGDVRISLEEGRIIEEGSSAVKGARAAKGVEAGTEISQRTVQDIFDKVSSGDITPEIAKKELAKIVHPDIIGDNAGNLLGEALNDLKKVIKGEKFERSRDWSKVSRESFKKPKVEEGVGEGAKITKGAETGIYTKDVNGLIRTENYERMSAEELLQEYKNLREYEASGTQTPRMETPSGKRYYKNSHDVSTQKAQIREILKEKYKLDRNGNPIKSEPGVTEVKPNVKIGEGGEYTLDANEYREIMKDRYNNYQLEKETLNSFHDGDIIELNYKGGKGPISERRVKEDGGYRKLKENGGKYEATETVVTEEEMATKLRDATTFDRTESPTVIELNYKGGKGPISERRVKEDGGYRKFEGEGGKYKRTETVLTEDEMAINLKDVKSKGGTGIEVGKGTDVFEWAESKATEASGNPLKTEGLRGNTAGSPKIEYKTMKKSEVQSSTLQEGDIVTRDGQEMRITKKIENEGKVSYEFEYTEGGTTQKISMTAEDLAGDWSNINNIMRPQDVVKIKGMNEYFKENVASCNDKKLYIEGNEYTAAIDENGALHLKYTGGHDYPIKYEIGKDGKLHQVKNEALQNDITVSSFDQLKTEWNASPIDDGRAMSGSLRKNATELTADEAANTEFWNKLWKEEKEWTRTSKEKPVTEKPIETVESVKATAEPGVESPIAKELSSEGYKSPIDTFDELLNSPEGVTIEGVNYKWDFSEFDNPPKHIQDPNWRPNIKLQVTENGVTRTFEAKYNPGRKLEPGEVVQPTKVLPAPDKVTGKLPSKAERLKQEYYKARQKYVENYEKSMPVKQGEGGAVVEKPGVPAVVEKPGVPAVVEKPGVPAVVEKPGVKPVNPEIKPPLIPNVPLWVSGAVVAILANKDHKEPIHIDVPGTTGFEWTPEDQTEVSEFQEFLSRSPSGIEIKDFIRSNKDAFKKLILVKDGVKGGANVNFDLLNYLIEQGKFNGLDGNIQEQLKHDIIRYIGLGEVLEEGTTFTVTSVDGKVRSGKIVNNRAVDERGRYIPIFQGDHVESDALGFLEPIQPYAKTIEETAEAAATEEIATTGEETVKDPDKELDEKLEEV